jgi:hypothetical protein
VNFWSLRQTQLTGNAIDLPCPSPCWSWHASTKIPETVYWLLEKTPSLYESSSSCTQTWASLFPPGYLQIQARTWQLHF